MNCPVCGLSLQLKGIEEFENYTLVTRSCHLCRVDWVLRHEGNSIVSITQKGVEMEQDYGFDYTCPHCGRSSFVCAVFYPRTGWKCLNCGKIIPNENITPKGNFRLQDQRAPVGTSGRRASRSTSTYQRAPRASRPIPEGAVALAAIAQELKVEPKKLRSFLRKSNWRKPEEAKSAWLFSPEEAEELKKTFRR